MKHLLTILTILCIISTTLHADECQDPETLTPELKKAYYELKEIAKDVEGMSVSIRCTEEILYVQTIKKKEN